MSALVTTIQLMLQHSAALLLFVKMVNFTKGITRFLYRLYIFFKLKRCSDETTRIFFVESSKYSYEDELLFHLSLVRSFIARRNRICFVNFLLAFTALCVTDCIGVRGACSQTPWNNYWKKGNLNEKMVIRTSGHNYKSHNQNCCE